MSTNQHQLPLLPVAGNEAPLSRQDRDDSHVAGKVLANLFPDEQIRRVSTEFLADCIAVADEANPEGWSVTLFKGALSLQVGWQRALYMSRDRVSVIIDKQMLLDRMAEPTLEEFGRFGKFTDTVHGIEVSAARLNGLLPALWPSVMSQIQREARLNQFSRFIANYSPGVIEYLRETVRPDLPHSTHRKLGSIDVSGTRSSNTDALETSVAGGSLGDFEFIVRRAVEAQLMSYSPWQISTFVTTLQSKGFVILSGISGTGKTRLVQCFANSLPSLRTQIAKHKTEIILVARDYTHTHSRFAIPKRFYPLLDIDQLPNPLQVHAVLQEVQEPAVVYHDPPSGANSTYVRMNAKIAERFRREIAIGERFALGIRPSPDADTLTIEIMPEQDWRPSPEPASLLAPVRNLLFLPVRPDWRDSKSLLGYFNPLTDTYEWTPFLRFLEQASRNYRSDDPVAWFVMLDEMNLAHVEYYFADLLSVLESGRDADGWTREAIKLVYPDSLEVAGDLPPREMKLPPNLYVVGTVNIDETTHAFSPKVLDRAFSIELVDVDFTDYPPRMSDEPFELTDEQRRELLRAFTRNGRFHGIDKREIAAYVVENPQVRDRLQRLNEKLRPFTLHFGYRVFDEIVTFLICADENGMFDDLGGQAAAFDAAVLMKVLPKFHGSRGKLESPLVAVLDWCMDPDNPQPLADNVPDAASFALPATARRVQRMLHELRTEGFTTFG